MVSAARCSVIKLSDPRYAILQSYVHQLWQGYSDLFPEETRQLNEPPVILLDSEVVNAFIAKDPESSNALHAVFVLTGLLDSVGGVDKKEPIAGVIAHELAHSVFKHILPKYQRTIDKFYRLSSETMGYHATRDTALDNQMDQWLEGAAVVGDLTDKELLNLPSPGAGRPWMLRIWPQMRKDFSDTSLSCTNMYKSLRDWAGYSKMNLYINAYSLSPTTLNQFEQKSQDLIAQQKSCFGSSQKPFKDLVAEALHVSRSVIDSVRGFDLLANLFDRAENATEGLPNVVSVFRGEMTDIESKLQLSEIGYFTFEEHADDMSVIVQSYVKLKADSVGDFFMKIMAQEEPASAMKCSGALSGNKMPPVGSFTDPHRSPCYRIAHVAALKKAIEQDPAQSVPGFAHVYLQTSVPKTLPINIPANGFRALGVGVKPTVGPLGFRAEVRPNKGFFKYLK